LIVGALVGAWLDEWIEGRGLSPFWQDVLGRPTAPPGVVAFIVVSAVGLLASWELARILRDNGIRASTAITCLASQVGLVVAVIVPSSESPQTAVAVASTAAGVVLVSALLFHTRNERIEGIVAAAGGSLLAFVYLGLMWGFILALRREASVWFLVWVLLVTKSCDIGAYFTGRSFGRHKLIPWLSPGKTWEGLGGGMLVSAACGAGGLWLVVRLDGGYGSAPRTVLVAGLLVGGLLGLVGQAGDLVASMFKRDAGRKDASGVLPGFGGMLDVLDSLILAFPVAYWLHHLFAGAVLG